jgi:hypothetical protein
MSEQERWHEYQRENPNWTFDDKIRVGVQHDIKRVLSWAFFIVAICAIGMAIICSSVMLWLR